MDSLHVMGGDTLELEWAEGDTLELAGDAIIVLPDAGGGFEMKVIDFDPDEHTVSSPTSIAPSAYSQITDNQIFTNPSNLQYIYPGVGLNPDQGMGFADAQIVGAANSGSLKLPDSVELTADQVKMITFLPEGVSNPAFILSAISGELAVHDYIFIALSAYEDNGLKYIGTIFYKNSSETQQGQFEADDGFIEAALIDNKVQVYVNKAGLKTLTLELPMGGLNSIYAAKIIFNFAGGKTELTGSMPFVNSLSSSSFEFPDDIADGTYLKLTKPYTLLGYDLLTNDVLQVYDNHTKGLVIRQQDYFDYLITLFGDDALEQLQQQVDDLESQMVDKITTVQLSAAVEPLATKQELASKATFEYVSSLTNQKADRSELYDKVNTATFDNYTSQVNSSLSQLQTGKVSHYDFNNMQLDVLQLLNRQPLKADLVNGVVPASQLPSYVDDVISKESWTQFPPEGEDGKIYIDKTTNKSYRWAGSGYTVISDTISLGETSSTAYRGDRGKTAYDHSQSTGNPHNTQIADIPNLQYQLSRRVDSSDATYQAIQNYYVNNGVEFAGLGYPNFINGGNTDITQKGTAYSLKFDSGFGYVAFATNAPNIGSWWYMRNGQSNSVRRYGFELFAYDEITGNNTYVRSMLARVTNSAGASTIGRIYKSDDPVIYDNGIDTLDNLVSVLPTGELKRSITGIEKWASRLTVWGGETTLIGNVSPSDTLANALWKLQNSKEPNIASGTTSQYLRGDKTWQTLGNAASLNTGTSSGAVLTVGTYGVGLPSSISTQWNTDGNLTSVATVNGANYFITAGSVAALGYGMGLMRRVDATKMYGFTVSTNGNNGRMFYFDLTYDSNTSTWVKTVWEQYGTGNTIKDANGFIKASGSSAGDAVIVNQLTKAQYDALTTTEKNSTSKLYVIVG